MGDELFASQNEEVLTRSINFLAHTLEDLSVVCFLGLTIISVALIAPFSLRGEP